MQLKFEEKWRAGVETPPFAFDNASAVDLLKAVLDRAVGTPISHLFKITKAVAAQTCQLLLTVKDAAARRAFAPHSGLSAVYILLASHHFKVRVAAPCKDWLRRFSNIMTRKTVGKGAAGKRAGRLVESFCNAVNQHKYSADVASLTAVQAEQ
eukprot:311842-Pleurochrysis_carterae.AAC.1